ncbi:unnamed protein product, partial [Didymodactylos carnosus]
YLQNMTKKAADLTRVSSQSEEENEEPENDDGYSGGTCRESQVTLVSMWLNYN